MTHTLFVRLAALSAALVLVACGGGTKKCTSNADCTTAGQVCNLSTGACETGGTGGGTGGGGGGSGGGVGGGSGGGGGGVGGGSGGGGGGGGVIVVDGGTIAGGETCDMPGTVNVPPSTVFSATTTGLMSNYDVAVTATGSGCNGYRSHPGADAVYKLTVPARSRLDVTVQTLGPDGSSMAMPAYDPAVYLVASPASNCATALSDGGVQATCIAASADTLDTVADLIAPETLSWKNVDTTPAEVFVVIESGWEPTVTGIDSDGDGTDDAWAIGQGDFSATVVITALPPTPGNDTCASATALAGTGTAVNGTTMGANADITFDPNGNCASTTGLGDVFYSVTIPAGKRATVSATTQAADTTIGMNLFEGACTNVATCRSAVSQTSGMAASVYYDNRGTADITVLVEVATSDANDVGADFSISATVDNIPPPPGNDACGSAATLATSTSTPGTIAGSTADMFTTGSPATCEAGQGGSPMKDVFYTLSVPAGQRATITVTPAANLDPVVNVTDAPGTCTGVTACVAAKDSGSAGDPEVVRYDNTTSAAVTLLVQVGSWDGEEGTFAIEATVAAIPPPPANDTCAAPTVLTSGVLANGTTVSSTPEMLFGASPTGCEASGSAKKDVFYSLVIPAGKLATIVVTPDMTMDPFINVIASTAGCTGVAACLSGADVGFEGDVETATYTAGTASETVLIQVGAWGGVEAPFTITATLTP